ncbi:MAG: helix-turn-helix domain-containing protein [Desulfobacterales bacterium]|nr:helix-turn-helix domain-containing protein [Desulfobacterales bacterium]
MAKISLWVGDGSLSSSVTTLMDAFSIADLWHSSLAPEDTPPLFETEIVTTDGKPITAYGNIRIEADRAAIEVRETDCVVFSPILPNITPVPETLPALSDHIKNLKKKGTALATVCTGTFVLAEMGLLDGKRATTNWMYARLFRKRYPQVKLESSYMLTEDENIICAGAATAVYNLALHLIRKFGSQHLASLCSKALLVDPNRVSQAPYTMAAPLRHHGDAQVLKAQEIIENQFADLETIDDLAKDVGISPRHFKRRFKKATGELPLKYLQRVRIDAAKERLETTRDSIDKITWAVGYKDVSSFCRLFKQHTQISPRAYRDKFYIQVPW